MPQPAGGSLLRTLGLQSVAPHVCGATSGVSFVPALSCCDTLRSRPTALPQRQHLACPSAAWAPSGSPRTCLWSSPQDVPVTVPRPSTGSGLQTHTAACSPATSHLWSSDGDPLCTPSHAEAPRKQLAAGPSQPPSATPGTTPQMATGQCRSGWAWSRTGAGHRPHPCVQTGLSPVWAPQRPRGPLPGCLCIGAPPHDRGLTVGMPWSLCELQVAPGGLQIPGVSASEHFVSHVLLSHLFFCSKDLF